MFKLKIIDKVIYKTELVPSEPSDINFGNNKKLLDEVAKIMAVRIDRSIKQQEKRLWKPNYKDWMMD